MSQLLRVHIESIVSLTDAEFDLVMEHFTVKRFKKHQLLIQEGDFVRNDYFLLSGLMYAAHTNMEGKEHILQFTMPGCWITDPEAYHHQTPATLSISCLEDSEALSISFDNREQLCASLQKMEHFFRKQTTASYIELQKRVLCLISTTAKHRYENLVQAFPGLIQRVPKSLLASYLGVTRETLSRITIS
jgi:CRP-like cAMP-binding protein